jgi:hypothetical protein
MLSWSSTTKTTTYTVDELVALKESLGGQGSSIACLIFSRAVDPPYLL